MDKAAGCSIYVLLVLRASEACWIASSCDIKSQEGTELAESRMVGTSVAFQAAIR